MELPIPMAKGQAVKPEDIPESVTGAVLRNMPMEKILLLDTQFTRVFNQCSAPSTALHPPLRSKAFKQICV